MAKKTIKKNIAKKKAPAKKHAAVKTAIARAARPAKRVAKPGAKRPSKIPPAKTAPVPDPGDKLTFNHAMIYAKDVQRALDFYREWLGFKLIEDFRYEGKTVYAR